MNKSFKFTILRIWGNKLIAFSILTYLFLTCGIKVSAQTAYAVLDDTKTVLTFYFNNNKDKFKNSFDISTVNSSNTDISPEWNSKVTDTETTQKKYQDINTVVFDQSFANFKPTTCYDWFDGMEKLTTIKDIKNLNTEASTSTKNMFKGCSNLTDIDFSNFSTTNVEDMESMFEGCAGLTTLNLSSFNTSKLRNLTKMFEGCTNLRTILTSKYFVTTNAESVSPNKNYDVFKDCKSLYGVITYDAEKTDMTYANYETGYFCRMNTPYAIYDDTNKILTFKAAVEDEEVPTTAYKVPTAINSEQEVPWKEKKMDVSKVVFDESFQYARPTSCAYWFASFFQLSDIQDIKNLNTSRTTKMEKMFYGCNNLKKLNLSTCDTKNVTDMSNMFYNCSALVELNLSDFNTANVTNMSNMFMSCHELQSLDLSSFTTDKVEDMSQMFQNCSKMKSVLIGTFKVTKKDGKAQQIFDSSYTTGVYTTPALYATNDANDFRTTFLTNRLQVYSKINTKAEYGTICLPQGCDLLENDFSGFDNIYEVGSIADGVVSLNKVTKMEPGKPYIFHRSAKTTSPVEGAITFVPNYETEATEADQTGALRGTFVEMTNISDPKYYILQSDGMFHRLASSHKIGANRAYLYWNNSASSNKLTLSLDNVETSINGVTEKTTEDNAPVYDLMGRRVDNMVKGHIYMKSGKKFVF